MAMLGKAVRLSRLVDSKSNKMMAITVDHAISRGIAGMKGLQPIQDTIDKIILGCPNAITMTKGIAERCMWCTCQQKLDTKLKKSGIKNESMYKIHQLF